MFVKLYVVRVFFVNKSIVKVDVDVIGVLLFRVMWRVIIGYGCSGIWRCGVDRYVFLKLGIF